jgi:hypothetical protein
MIIYYLTAFLRPALSILWGFSKFIFWIQIILLFSCTSYVSISTTALPEINLPDDSTEFLFVNRFVPNNLDYKKDNKLEVYEIGLEKYIEGLKAGFDTNGKINLIFADTIIASHSAHEPAYNLSTRIIQELCGKYDPDYILSLDNYDLFFDKEVEVEEYDDGSKSRTAHYDLVLNTYITIYSINGMALDKLKEELRTHHDSRAVASGLLAVGPSMGKADENVIALSDELGRIFINKFDSTRITEMRPFYSSKEFKEAYQAFKMERWDAVEEELLLLSENPDPKIQGKAAYNLGVLYENLDRRAEMDYWYKEAKEKLGSLPTITN